MSSSTSDPTERRRTSPWAALAVAAVAVAVALCAWFFWKPSEKNRPERANRNGGIARRADGRRAPAGPDRAAGREPSNKASQQEERHDEEVPPEAAAKTHADVEDPAGRASVEDLVDRVDEGVVLIRALDSDGEEVGLGSGFVIDPAGLVVTNYHVIARANQVQVQLHNQTRCDVTGYRAMDPDADLVILELKDPPDKLEVLSLRSEGDPRPGSNVIAIGHPHGFRYSVTTGIVSAVHRTADLPGLYRELLDAPSDQVWIQTSAPISPGNSGGPLLDERGDVIGINTWVAGGENLGFAVHIRHVAALLDRLRPEAVSLSQLAEPREKLVKLVQEYQGQYRRFLLRWSEPDWTEERNRLSRTVHPLMRYSPRFLDVAAKYPESPIALEALLLVYLLAEENERVQVPEAVFSEAGDRILEHHLKDPKLLKLVRNLSMATSPATWDLLRRIIASSEDSALKGMASFSLAMALHSAEAPDGRFDAEIESLLEKVSAEYGGIETGGKTLAVLARPILAEVRQMSIGRPAPETIGMDAEGSELDLSEYRGRVVVLHFWEGLEEEHDSDVYTNVRRQIQRHAGVPFAVLGVSASDAETLEYIKSQLPCRIFDDGPDGPIAKQWHVTDFPTAFVIDHEGIIRYRHVEGGTLKAVVRELLGQVPAPQLNEALSVAADQAADTAAPGVVADRVVIWNQHNGDRRDRGTTSLAVRLFRHDQQVWKQEGVEIPWTANQDTHVDVPLPQVPFDRLRVDVEAFQGSGGGLSEIQVFQGDHNLARGCPTQASRYFDDRFSSRRVTDGVTSSNLDDVGYWLLPDRTKGWVEVDLALAQPADQVGITAEQIVIWNQYNPPDNDRGTSSCIVRLLLKDQEVWSRQDVAVPWQANKDASATVELPPVAFDRLRVEVETWRGRGGALSEVQVMRGGQNIALGCPVTASRVRDATIAAERLTDGMITPSGDGVDDWLLPDFTRGWIEIDLSSAVEPLAEARRRLAAYRCFIQGDWQAGLPWMARSDHVHLRQLGDLEQRNAFESELRLVLGSGWWGLAQRASGTAKERLLARALHHYLAVENAGLMDQAALRMIRYRTEQFLPTLPERNYLYFRAEESAEGVHRGGLRVYRLKLGGKISHYALWARPPGDGESRVVFRLAGRYRRFQGAAAIEDAARRCATPLVFRVLGDGKELWRSEPLQEVGGRQDFDVEVAGVDELALVTECPGSNEGAFAIWVDPRLQE